MDFTKKQVLQEKCLQFRYDLINMLFKAQTGHPGSSLSAVEILTTLYFEKMIGIDSKYPESTDRDRLVLGKGHAAPILYIILAELGFFPKEDLKTLRKLGSHLQGHPNVKATPGIDYSSAPIGQGLSVGVGMALAAKLDSNDYTTYVVLGDGETQEGMIWEAAMAAAKFKVDNMVVILDKNGVQLDGTTDEVMPLGDVQAKWQSFGWNTISIDGHDMEAISNAVDKAKTTKGMPTIIIANTIKGKGISYMEGKSMWHGKPIDEEHYKLAISELGGAGI